MITPNTPTPDQPVLDEAEQKIFASMSALLKRAGLDYRGHFVEVNGQRIHYLEYGDGPPVLLLHGGGAGSAIWFRQIEVLSKSYRIIAPDHPVFGLSGQVAYKAPLVTSLIRYMTGFMDALELKITDVVGLSMGAQAALAMAIDRPERVGKLVVIDSAGLGKDFPVIFKLATVPFFGRLVVRPNRWGQDNYFKTMEVVNSKFDDAGAYRSYAYDVTLPAAHARVMKASLGVITSFGGQKAIFSDEELQSIRSPLLAIWGKHDKVFPVEHGYRLAEHVPDSKLHVIENAAHVPILDNPDQVNDLLVGFLRRD
jgi:pimeloyl-ACP methyl ester carboxylesterase